MAGTRAGAVKAAATRMGVRVEFYLEQRDAGLRHCWCCKTWKMPPLFPQNSGKPGAVSGKCLECSRVKVRKSTKGRPGTFAGHTHTDGAKAKMAEAHTGSRNHRWQGGISPDRQRDPDKVAARRAVNHAVEAGRLASASSLPCLNCGSFGIPADEYHHHRGCGASCQLDVQALCRQCHRRIHAALRA